MRKRLSILVLSLILGCFSSNAQDTDPFSYNANIIPSAEAWKMARYGNAMPSLYTGAMTFSLPLYTYKDEDFEIPLSLEYRYDGYKPSQPSGFIGFGWNMNCGGVVTREIIGLPDDFIDYNNTRGYYYLAIGVESPNVKSALVNDSLSTQILLCQPSPVISEDMLPNIFYGSAPLVSSRPFPMGFPPFDFDGLLFDSASDVYHFSLPDGRSGSFIILPSGEIKVFDSSTGEGEYHITVDFSNSRNLTQTIIIETGDGYSFEFGTDYHYIEYSSLPQWEENQCILSDNNYCFAALYLRTIIAPNGRQILFDRESVHPYFELSFSPGIHYRYQKLQSDFDPDFYDFGTANFNTRDKFISTISHHLSSVKIDNVEIINFHYAQRASLEYSYSSFSPSYSNSSDIFPQIPGTIGISPTTLSDRLSSVTIRDFSGTVLDSVILSHSYTSSASHHSPKMFLRTITSNDGQFEFHYNNDTPSDFYPPVDCRETDHWGYWRGVGGTFSFNDMNIGCQDQDLYNLPSINKNPDSTFTSHGALRVIRYPTGGMTNIDYECNRVFQRINIDVTNSMGGGFYIEQCDNYPAGGLRVKQITNTAGQYGSYNDTTRFDYRDSGLLYKMPRYSARLKADYFSNSLGTSHTKQGIYVMDSYGSISVCSQECFSSHIEYPLVSIHNADGSSVEYKFTNYLDFGDIFASDTDGSYSGGYYFKYFATNRNPDTGPLSPPDCTLYVFGNNSDNSRKQNSQLANIKISDFSYLRGRPVEINNRDGDGSIIEKTVFSYDTLNISTVKDVVNHYSHLSLVNRCYSRIRQSSVTVTDYSNGAPVTSTMSYEYNSLGQRVSEKAGYSSGRFGDNIYLKYAHESDSTALRCEVSDAVRTRVVGGDEYVTAYSHFDYGVSGLAKPTGLKIYDIETPYLRPGNVFTVPNAGFRQSSFQYNALHRLTRASYPGGAYVQYGWDSDGRHLISRTENGPANETTYQWIDMVGLSQKRTPTYQLEYYEYDGRGRLRRVKNTGGFTVTLFDYFLNND